MYFGNLGTYIPRNLPFGNHPTLSQNLRVYWPLNETSGSRLDVHQSLDLTTVAGVTFTSAGKNGNAFANIYPSSTSPASRLTALLAPATNITYSGWVKILSSFGNNCTMLAVEGATISYQTRTQAGGFVSSLLNTVGADVQAASGALSADTWHHVLVMIDITAKTITQIINSGTPVVSSALVGSLNTSVTSVSVGGIDTTSQHIDEVAVWGRLLTLDERNALYNGGNGLFY